MASGTSVDNTLTSGFSLEYDSRNLKQFASSGMYLYINYLHNGFGISNISYNEMSFELRKYQKVYDEIVIKGRIHSKHVFGKYIPPYNLVRFGYDYYTRGERYIVSEGKNRFLGSVELSYPLLSEWNFAIDLPIIPKSLSRSRIAVHASIFADIGKVIDRPIDLKLKNFDSGYGAGITFLFLPYNSFRVEYAFNKMGEGELLIETGISF
jgi:outer membrane protein assembly factor BamA